MCEEDEDPFDFDAHLFLNPAPKLQTPFADEHVLRGQYKCFHCGNNELTKFEYSDVFACCVCDNCGACCNDYNYSMYLRDRQKFASFCVRNKETYVRKAHICERLSQAQMEEPRIPADEKRHIERVDAALGPAAPGTFEGPGGQVAARERVKTILKALKADRVTMLNGSHNWTLYLEKWKTIANDLFAPQRPSFTWEAATTIGAVMVVFSDCWNTFNPPKKYATRQRDWRFPERQHFPNFNGTIRAIAQALGADFDPQEFPIPTSKKIVGKLNTYLEALFSAAVAYNVHLTFVPFPEEKSKPTFLVWEEPVEEIDEIDVIDETDDPAWIQL